MAAVCAVRARRKAARRCARGRLDDFQIVKILGGDDADEGGGDFDDEDDFANERL
jgi:hypothetical protein